MRCNTCAVDSLSSFQRADQKNEYRERAEKAIKQVSSLTYGGCFAGC